MNVCFLCKSSEKDDIQYGEFLKNSQFGVHTFCLYLSSNLAQNGDDGQGFLGFLPEDIRAEVQRISLLKCCYCYKKYANIGCCEKKCRRCFHLICGIKNKAENRFCYDYRSYCDKHVRKVVERPSSTENCLICFDSLCAAGKKFNAIEMIMTPCCRNGWFHKLCLQRFASTSGYFFKCPLCNDDKVFREKLPAKGIFIPDQDAAWELEPNAFAELLERPNVCAAPTCQNKKGRNAKHESNPFVMCHTCGSVAIHKKCLLNDGGHFTCTDCSVALEERDSGIESLNSQAHQIDDEYIDVCHVSDKEDLELINKLVAASVKMSANKRDSGTKSNIDSSDEEMPHTMTKYRQIEGKKEEKSTSDNDSEIIKPCVSKQTSRLILESESSETSRNTEVSGEQEELIKANRRRKGLYILSDSDDEILLPKQKRLNSDNMEEKYQTTLQSRKNSAEESDDSSDSDPLDTFFYTRQKANNQIRTLSKEKQENKNNEPSDDGRKFNPTKNKANGYKGRRTFVDLTKQEAEKHLDVSCIALRTRRKTFCGIGNNKSAEKKHNENGLDESCIASRTRRKTICGRSDFNKQTEREMSLVYERLQQSNENIELSTDDEDSRSEPESHLNEISCDSVSDNFIVDDGYMDNNDSKYEVSCIANRTRRRKSIKCQRLSKIVEVSDCSSDSSMSPVSARKCQNFQRLNCKPRLDSNSSEEFHTPSLSLPKSDLNNSIGDNDYPNKDSKYDISCIANRTRRRKNLKCQEISKIIEVSDCSSDSSISSVLPRKCKHIQRLNKKRRIISTSSEDFHTTPSALPKSSAYKLEKFPVQNFISVLTHNNNKKPESSNSKHIFNYHPSNFHHPHSTNRNRI